jgi:transcriptional accessory protein Tex/SPT6
MWRKDLTAIVVAGLSLVTDVRAQAHTPAADGVRSDWQQVHALKTNTTVRIDLQDGSVVKGQMKTVTDNQVVVMIYETSSACQITRPAGTPSDPLLLPVGRGAMRP